MTFGGKDDEKQKKGRKKERDFAEKGSEGGTIRREREAESSKTPVKKLKKKATGTCTGHKAY